MTIAQRAFVIASAALMLALATSCTSEAGRSAAPPDEQDTVVEESSVKSSYHYYLSVQNSLPDTTVTWQVSETQNNFWDGSGRPDHTPPDGLQGLVQPPKSASYRVRTELNGNRSFSTEKANFTLTPVIELGNERWALTPLLILDDGDYWVVDTDRDINKLIAICQTPYTDSITTELGEFTYTMTARCSNPTTSIVITSANE
jgi:hypothetical protein